MLKWLSFLWNTDENIKYSDDVTETNTHVIFQKYISEIDDRYVDLILLWEEGSLQEFSEKVEEQLLTEDQRARLNYAKKMTQGQCVHVFYKLVEVCDYDDESHTHIVLIYAESNFPKSLLFFKMIS